MISLLLPAALAGVVAIAVTVAIERLGGQLGGALGTLPTTIVPASLGLYASEPATFHAALCVAPAGMLANALFLWSWRVVPDRLPALPLPATLGAMVVASTLTWAAAATLVLRATASLTAAGVPPTALGIAATIALVTIGVAACLDDLPAPRGARRVGAFALASRGLLAAAAIGVALWIAKRGDGALAGVASVFPAIFFTSMVSLWWSQGRAVSGGAVGPMMLGSASVAVYALGAAWWMPALGPIAGATLAWAVAAVGITWPAVVWLTRRRAAAAT